VKRYWLRLMPEQPLCLDNEYTIPASAVRGAIANVLLGTCVPGHEHDMGPCSAECRYWSLFGEGHKLYIGPAYAATGDETLPFLATARTCSRFPGFKTGGGHGVFDIAIRQWLFEQAFVEPSRLLAPFSLRCPVCDTPLIPCEGLFTRQGEREFVTVSDVATPFSATYTSMGRTRKQIVDRFTVDAKVIGRGTYYVARVEIPDPLDALLHQVVEGGLWIGGRKARGMGAVRAELVSYAPNLPPLPDRIAAFNRALRTEQRFYTSMGTARLSGDDGEWYFTLDLHDAAYPAYESSPSIAPTLAVLPAVVAVRQWLTAQTSGGWHMAAGLPRRTMIGSAGAIFYRVPAEANRRMVEEMLTFLEDAGIGVGRERGCGAARICDPFHLFMEPL